MTKRLVVLHSAEVAAMAFASAAAFMRSFGFFVLWLVPGLLSVAMYSCAYFFLLKSVIKAKNAYIENNISKLSGAGANSISSDVENIESNKDYIMTLERERKKVESQNKQILNNYSNNLINIISCFICGLIHVPWIYYYGIANGVLTLVILWRVIKRPQGHPIDESDF
ncbi:hypothetical protein CJ214_02880 [Peptoniphilus lacrimalis]|uniref:hypothetical protein n=1 Tax=Gardnerella TaxID=2701 RepID=UPI0002636291|nr:MULTISPECIES: hypothetical protein [Gardnerella]MDK6471746.1 hypothetical protein [Bifidobacterium sp. UMB9259]PMC45903.1 hypothetical protein CJ214_02880 [Peptoniphilus lacrimalis]EIK84718.1 hypothetical protein CGSMWGv00703C2mash_06166 [Gardnerella pickettii 00703C2mash]RDW97265.1 hypothetical protein gvb03_03810 [Gardnerella vaginalis]RDW97616.1 hypothetical protein gvb02_00920 [Gardnerella vaginalis]